MGLLYLAIALGHLIVMACATRLWLHARCGLYAVPAAVSGALVYDNLVVAFGNRIGPGVLLQQLTQAQMALHALLTPLLIVWAFQISRRLELPWAQRRLAATAAYLLAMAVVLVGVWCYIVLYEPVLQRHFGIIRYSTEYARQGAIAPIVCGVFVMVVGLSIWSAYRNRVLAVGSSFMALGAGFSTVPAVGQVGELVLITCMVVTTTWVLGKPLREAISRRQIASHGRLLGWAAFPLLVVATVLQYIPLGPGDIPPVQRGVGVLAQAIYQVLLIAHAQFSYAVYGYPPRGGMLRRVHVHMGVLNIPLLCAGMIAYMSDLAALGNAVTTALFLGIIVHVGIGTYFAVRRRRLVPISS